MAICTIEQMTFFFESCHPWQKTASTREKPPQFRIENSTARNPCIFGLCPFFHLGRGPSAPPTAHRSIHGARGVLGAHRWEHTAGVPMPSTALGSGWTSFPSPPPPPANLPQQSAAGGGKLKARSFVNDFDFLSATAPDHIPFVLCST